MIYISGVLLALIVFMGVPVLASAVTRSGGSTFPVTAVVEDGDTQRGLSSPVQRDRVSPGTVPLGVRENVLLATTGDGRGGGADRPPSSTSSVIRLGYPSPVTERSLYDHIEVVVPSVKNHDARSIIRGAAAIYGVDPEILLAVAWCESRGNPLAVGDNGASWGIFQFAAGTFLANARRAGLPYEDANLRMDVAASAMTAAYMFSIGEAKHWTCARMLGYA